MKKLLLIIAVLIVALSFSSCMVYDNSLLNSSSDVMDGDGMFNSYGSVLDELYGKWASTNDEGYSLYFNGYNLELKKFDTVLFDNVVSIEFSKGIMGDSNDVEIYADKGAMGNFSRFEYKGGKLIGFDNTSDKEIQIYFEKAGK